MPILILLPLFVSVTVVFVVLAGVFLDVAFAGPRAEHQLLDTSRQWQPPLARGDELLGWAASTAKAVTGRLLARQPNGETARRLAIEVYEGTTFAIGRSPNEVGQCKPKCASCRNQMIGVTPPEALAIAATIRDTKNRWEAKRIHDRAIQNAELAASLSSAQYEQTRIDCPLAASDGSCALFDARPLHCRSHCLLCGADVDPRSHGGNEGPCDVHALTVGRGAEQGLSEGLKSAGLDGQVYELNSALAVALAAPHSAQRWAQGESVFAACKRCE